MPLPRKHIFHDLAGKNRRTPIANCTSGEGRGPFELEYPVICSGGRGWKGEARVSRLRADASRKYLDISISDVPKTLNTPARPRYRPLLP